MSGGISGDALRALLPHAGAMCLLHAVARWDGQGIDATAISHLDPANPLRLGGRLGPVAGMEYGMQAAALHGGLLGDAPAAPGWLAAIRHVAWQVDRLDDSGFGTLRVSARLLLREARGLIYDVAIQSEDGRALVDGRGSIAFPAMGCMA